MICATGNTTTFLQSILIDHTQPSLLGGFPAGRLAAIKREHGQTTVFITLILTGLLLLTAVVIEISRIAYARDQVGKGEVAAALAATSRINVALFRETW